MGEKETGGKVAGRKRVRKSNAELVEEAIQAFAKNNGSKPTTVSEFIRLLELQKELGASQPKEIIVRWVEPREIESSEK
jgi:hypothetical protein